MVKQIDLVLSPDAAANSERITQSAAHFAGVKPEEITHIEHLKKSIDARKKRVVIRLRVNAYINEAAPEAPNYMPHYPDVSKAPQVIVVGSGPAGLFAALQLIELGLRPMVIERGQDVSLRRKDLSNINTKNIVNPDSNYCFGEGGAGTYSDGKLYTRSKKRGSVAHVLQILVAFGANPNIMVDAHPHIGTNKLPKIIKNMRLKVKECGGDVLFGERVTDFIIEQNTMKGVVTQTGKEFIGESVVVATGHSARDIFELLHAKNIEMEAKPFALGVRIEHPQKLIDGIQYHCETDRNKNLPAASYGLVTQAYNRGVYSFCMCPGGFIVPAATEPGEVVVNGMSTSARDSRYANSGIVVEVDQKLFAPYLKEFGPLAAMHYQKTVEQKAFAFANNTQAAPAQRMVDFVNGKFSNQLNDTSYIPGLTSTQITDVLPTEITKPLRQAFQTWGKKMRGYFTNEAQIVGVESRTSSPIKIPRNAETLENDQIAGFYPSGEGAGYAGGIMSAAIDGIRVAQAIAVKLGKS